MKEESNDRRDFIKKIALAGAGIALLNKSFAGENNFTVQPETGFVLPALPYGYDALEPHIDKQTMEIHYTKHHKGYVDKLNKALAEASITGISLEDLCKNISKYSVAIRNNAGGHYNHSMFWTLMKPNGGTVLSPPATSNEPSGKIGDVIKSSFDSFSNFKTKFSEKALSVFGSGWVWLVSNKDGKLEIGTTPNQDNPLMDLPAGQAGILGFKGHPILALDVWEHAYYLKYQNKRPDYVNAWWNLVNWEEVTRRFEGNK